MPQRSGAGGTSAFRSGGILVVNGTPVIRSVLSSLTRYAAGKSSVCSIHSCRTPANSRTVLA